MLDNDYATSRWKQRTHGVLAMTAPGELALFSLDTDPDYARRVASYLGVELARHELRHFEDGEHKCRALDSSAAARCVHHLLVVRRARAQRQRQTVRAAIFCRLTERCGRCARHRDSAVSLLRAQGPAHADQTIPSPRATWPRCSKRSVSTALSPSTCITFQPMKMLFVFPPKHLCARPLFVDYFRAIAQHADIAVVAPDFGAAKRAEHFLRELGTISSAKSAWR